MTDTKDKTPETKGQNKDPKGNPDNIVRMDDLLRQREKLDRDLENNFSRRMAIFFTDIVGSTPFYEAHGDIAGRLLIQKHNDLCFPIMEEMGGKVIKTTGDGMLASFDSCTTAVQAVIRMQEAVRDYNEGKNEIDQCHIRIGMNFGQSLVDVNDIYGDVVNTCARITACADGGQIVMSETVYKEVKREEGVYVRFLSSEKLKGKSQPMKIYQVLWCDEDFDSLAGAAGMVRSFRRQRAFCIDVTRENGKLKIATYEREEGKELTLRHYEESAFDADKISARCDEIYALLNKANVEGAIDPTLLEELQKVGGVLYDEILTSEAKDRLRKTLAPNLVLSLDDALVQIPWELMYDGKAFLSRRFSMGRIVRTKQTPGNTTPRTLGSPLKVLVLADPRRDLEQSYKEGIEVRDLLADKEDKVKVDLVSSRVSVDFVKKNLKNYDIIHYAGHADYDPENPSKSAWKLSDGDFTAADIMAMAGGEPMPAVVFSNGCQSAQTDEWKLKDGREVYGLANSFLLSGIQHYIGTFWEVRDRHSMDFSTAFYRALLTGAPIGEALRLAREGLIRNYGEDNIVWASYILYGDPTARLISHEQTAEDFLATQEEIPAEAAAGGLRSAAALTAPMPGLGRWLQDNITTVVLAVLAVAVIAILARGPFNQTPAPMYTPPMASGPTTTSPAVPQPSEPLRLTMNVIGQREDMFGEWEEVIMDEGSILRSGDQFQVHFNVNKASNVYLILYDSQKVANILFPDPKIEIANPVQPGVTYNLPGGNNWWWLDDNTGTETLYLVTAEEPLENIETLLVQMDGLEQEERYARYESLNNDLLTMTRGVGGITKGKTKVYRLEDGKEIEKITEIVEGQGKVVRAISFRHM